MFKQNLIIYIFISISVIAKSQDLRFSFDVDYNTGNSVVNYYVEFPSDGLNNESEVIYGHTLAAFYDNVIATPSSWTDAPLGWTFDGSISLSNSNNTQSGYNSYAEVQRIDGTTTGTQIDEGDPRLFIGSLTFTATGGNVLLVGTSILPAIRYASHSGSGEHDILIIGTTSAPLPITIKTFSATKDGERSSRLDWTTVGQVKAAGNSNRDIDYIYYDRSLPMARSIDNIFYYRLRLTDLDGQYKYSETRGVNMGRLEGLVSIYPNPATDIINVDLTDMDLHEGIIHLSVYDNTGKAIISKEVNGAGIEPIQASNMAAGTYNVVVKQGDTTHRKQIIVVN
jgi:hypothetical protein